MFLIPKFLTKADNWTLQPTLKSVGGCQKIQQALSYPQCRPVLKNWNPCSRCTSMSGSLSSFFTLMSPPAEMIPSDIAPIPEQISLTCPQVREITTLMMKKLATGHRFGFWNLCWVSKTKATQNTVSCRLWDMPNNQHKFPANCWSNQCTLMFWVPRWLLLPKNLPFVPLMLSTNWVPQIEKIMCHGEATLPVIG